MHLLLKTLLNHVEPLEGFVYESSRLLRGGALIKAPRIEIHLRERHGSRGKCSRCRRPAAGYDRLEVRHFQFVPLWGLASFFLYAPRRVQCRRCGVCVEHLPWALGKRPLTQSFAWFLASWAKLLSWQEVSRTFKTSWESVFRSVERAVDWGRVRMDLTGITALGVDEIHWRKGKFLTLVYQINEGMKRLLFVAGNREEKSLRKFFLWLGAERSAAIRFICSDMWRPYLNVMADNPAYSNKALGIQRGSRLGTKQPLSDAAILAFQERMVQLGRPCIGSILELQRAFGLREVEAIRAGQVETLSRWQRELQDRGRICVIEGTKGGHQREVHPADLKRALAAVQNAQAVLEATGQTYLLTRANGAVTAGLEQAVKVYTNLCSRAGIQNHGARYAFARERVLAYRDQGYSEREARAATSLDLGHGDGRGRYVASVYVRGA